MTRWWWLVLLPLVAGSCSLFETDEFVCTLDNECPGTSGGYGKCVLGHCAFNNDACASGLMYDETAGDVAKTCVNPQDLVPDAAPAPDAPGPAIDAGPVSADSGASTVDGAPPPDA